MRNALAIILAVLFLSAAPTATLAEEFVQWPNNGHYYKAVHTPEGISWADAKARAEEAGGYLATLTSSKENKFVFSLIDDERFWNWHGIDSHFGPWIGGYQEDGSEEPDGGWKWVTGEKFAYTRWAPREPYGRWGGFDENRLQYYSISTERKAEWNDAVDLHEDHNVRGYIIEKDSL